MDHVESLAERRIREAQEQGVFDNLPGAGKPLKSLGKPDSADWWLENYLEREQIDTSSISHPALALRKQATELVASLGSVRTEASVRELVDAYNAQVRRQRLAPVTGRFPPPVVKMLDVDEALAQWRLQREAAQASAPAPRP